VVGDVFGLQGLTVEVDEALRVALGPRREAHRVDLLPGDLVPKVESVLVGQELGQIAITAAVA
jgi:hypothetical protein